MYTRKQKGWVKHLDFILIDIFCTLLSFRIALMIWFGFIRVQAYPSNEILNHAMVGLVLVTLLVGVFGQFYHNILHRGFIEEFFAILKHRVVLLAAFSVFLFASKEASTLSRGTVGMWLGIDIILGYTLRNIWKAVVRKNLIDSEQKSTHLLIIADYDKANTIIERIQNRKYNGFYTCGVVVFDKDCKGESIRGIEVVCNISEIKEYMIGAVVDAVFLSTDDIVGKDEIADYLLKTGVTVHMDMDPSLNYRSNIVAESQAGFNVLTLSNNSVYGWQIVIKRLIDICGGIVGTIATGILYLYIAPKIKKIDPGPVFFKQTRVGQNGRKFQIYKFRSMYMNAEERKKELMDQNKMDGLMFKIDDDPRILPGFGKFIREQSLDEFPQFYNVLKGEMSLVGTRPPTEDEFANYRAHHKARLSFKPGITGLWQVSGRSNITDFEDIVKLDTEYIQNWTIRMDIKILLKTFKVAFKREGAK